MRRTLPLFFFLFSGFTVYAQSVNKEAVQNLLGYHNTADIASREEQMLNLYTTAGPEQRKQLFSVIDEFTRSKDLHLSARSLYWKGIMIARPPFNRSGDGFAPMQQSLAKAVQSGDEYLMVQAFENYGGYCRTFGNPEIALFYYLKSAELRNKLDDNNLFIKNYQHFGTLGDQLFQMQEYDKAIEYLKLALRTPAHGPIKHTGGMNTMGLAYQRTGKFDSAYLWFDKSLESAKANHDTIWEGIVYGNIGALYFEQGQFGRALPLLWKDYTSTLATEPNSAGNTLHRIALLYHRTGKMDSALLLARKSYEIVSQYPYPNKEYIRNACFALNEIFRRSGNADSAYYYGDMYHRLNDTIQLLTAGNRADVVQTKLDFEKLSSNIKLLQQEKEGEQTKRKLLTAAICLLLAAGWFYFRWQKQQSKNRQQELLHQKQMAEAAVKNARNQLEEFTQHIINKNELIEKLEQQLHQQNMSINEELLQQTILTENDWLHFKDMFDKANPGFIAQLKTQAPDITTAELRLATLLKLNIGNKHIASMLGTSADAVRKTKSRLRQRLQLTMDNDLEEHIRSIKSES